MPLQARGEVGVVGLLSLGVRAERAADEREGRLLEIVFSKSLFESSPGFGTGFWLVEIQSAVDQVLRNMTLTVPTSQALQSAMLDINRPSPALSE